MMFWIAVMTGVIFAVVGIRRGFYATWALVFNILISIYLAVMLTPAVIGFIPNVDNFHYHQAVCIGGIAIIVAIKALYYSASLYHNRWINLFHCNPLLLKLKRR